MATAWPFKQVHVRVRGRVYGMMWKWLSGSPRSWKIFVMISSSAGFLLVWKKKRTCVKLFNLLPVICGKLVFSFAYYGGLKLSRRLREECVWARKNRAEVDLYFLILNPLGGCRNKWLNINEWVNIHGSTLTGQQTSLVIFLVSTNTLALVCGT